MREITLKAGTGASLSVIGFLYYESEARAGCVRNTDLTFSVRTPSDFKETRWTLDMKEFRRFVKELDALPRTGTAAELREPDHGSFLRFEADMTVTGELTAENGSRIPFRFGGITACDFSLFVYHLKFLIPD